MSLAEMLLRNELQREPATPGEVNRRGHHIVALESLSDTLGTPHDRVDYFQTLRDLRNKDLYTGGVHVTVREAEEAIEEAQALRSELEQWLGERGAGNR